LITGELKNKIDRLWDSFWSGGISNPLTVIEQITYLLFIRRLDDAEKLEEKKAARTGRKHESIFTEETLRWSVFKNFGAQQMFDNMVEKVFPFIKRMGEENDTFTKYMKDAVFMIQKPSLLAEAVALIDGINMDDADTKGDLYEYLLSKLATAGVNGQFRTPRHIIKMMVELIDPRIDDIICDPACGTAGFLVCSAEHVLRRNTRPESVFTDDNGNVHDAIGDLLNPRQWEHFRTGLLHGRDFDTSMLRISLMNLMFHGIESPDIAYADSLSSGYEEKDKYTVVLANPPFTGSIDEGDISPSLLKTARTKKTELLFLALIERILQLGGRCAVIVPDGVLFGSSKAHKQIRRMIVEENQLEAVISMPSGVFKPYAGVSTAVLVWTKGGRTDKVWFYDMQADGFSLDDKRNPVEQNDIPDVIGKWRKVKENPTLKPEKGEKWFWVDKERIVENGYDLSINKYKEIEYEEVQYEHPKVILQRLAALELEILKDIEELDGMVK
jgi:type I restriction enzyme M protein